MASCLVISCNRTKAVVLADLYGRLNLNLNATVIFSTKDLQKI